MKNKWNLKSDFILASSSPRRIELLINAGLEPEKIEPADIDESVLENEIPENYVVRVAKEKALHVAKNNPKSVVLGVDTIIVCEGKIVRKAKNESEARKNLEFLSDKENYAVSGYAIVSSSGKCIVNMVKTKVVFKKFTEQEIDCIIKSNEWQNVAAYKVQNMMSAMTKSIEGSYFNIVGLPIFEIAEDLKRIIGIKK